MNASDVLKYGHSFTLDAVAGLQESHWQEEGVCGWWSVRDIMAHLASFEHLLTEILAGFLGGGPTPYFDEYTTDPRAFNDNQVAQRDHMTARTVMDEYTAGHLKTMALIARIPAESICRPGALPWYGMEYALDDFIVYTFYGHKREHGAQINLYKDELKKKTADR